MRFLILAFLLSLVWLVPLARANASPAVSVVYFVPRDQSPTMTAQEADALMIGIQDWYESRVGSTFALQGAQVVRGKRSTAEYIDGGIWSPILIELGYWCDTGIHVIITHSSINASLGGTCDPAYSSGSRGGTALVSEAAFPSNCDIALWWCGFGGLAHDLGHAFTLPHPVCAWECSDTVMWAHWAYPDVGLLDIAEAPEITTLQNSVWFGASPEPTCTPKFNPHGKLVGKCR